MTIHEAYQKAGELHGHYCPGLAIGVRAAWEGRKALGEGPLSVLAERSACWLDGMSLVGATIGNGKLKIRDTGKAAFGFYHGESGQSVRLVLQPGPAGISREELIEWLLTAPAEAVFAVTDVKAPFPPYKPGSGDVLCSVCGEAVAETSIHVRGGQFVCCDCLE